MKLCRKPMPSANRKSLIPFNFVMPVKSGIQHIMHDVHNLQDNVIEKSLGFYQPFQVTYIMAFCYRVNPPTPQPPEVIFQWL